MNRRYFYAGKGRPWQTEVTIHDGDGACTLEVRRGGETTPSEVHTLSSEQDPAKATGTLLAAAMSEAELR